MIRGNKNAKQLSPPLARLVYAWLVQKKRRKKTEREGEGGRGIRGEKRGEGRGSRSSGVELLMMKESFIEGCKAGKDKSSV